MSSSPLSPLSLSPLSLSLAGTSLSCLCRVLPRVLLFVVLFLISPSQLVLFRIYGPSTASLSHRFLNIVQIGLAVPPPTSIFFPPKSSNILVFLINSSFFSSLRFFNSFFATHPLQVFWITALALL